jgi:hypothetical protein
MLRQDNHQHFVPTLEFPKTNQDAEGPVKTSPSSETNRVSNLANPCVPGANIEKLTTFLIAVLHSPPKGAW